MTAKKPNLKLTQEEARAQSVLKTQSFIKAMDVIEGQGQPGLWYTTTQEDITAFADWHMVRLIKSMPIYKSTAFIMSQKGYQFAFDILPTLRCIGFEKDGDLGTIDRGGNAMYMLCPPETRLQLLEFKMHKIHETQTAIRKSLGANLHNVPGLKNVEIRNR